MNLIVIQLLPLLVLPFILADIADPFDDGVGILKKNESNTDVRYEIRNGKKVKITRRVQKIVRHIPGEEESGEEEHRQESNSRHKLSRDVLPGVKIESGPDSEILEESEITHHRTEESDDNLEGIDKVTGKSRSKQKSRGKTKDVKLNDDLQGLHHEEEGEERTSKSFNQVSTDEQAFGTKRRNLEGEKKDTDTETKTKQREKDEDSEEEELEDLTQVDKTYGKKKKRKKGLVGNVTVPEPQIPDVPPPGGLQVAGPPIALVKGHCHTGWFVFNQHCYHVFVEPNLDWEQAQQKCQQHDGNLASIQSQLENIFMIHLIQHARMHSNLLHQHFWIGMKRQSSDGGKSFVSTWANGTPVVYGRAQSFPEHQFDHVWNANDFAAYYMWLARMEPWSETTFGNEQCVFMSLDQHLGVGWVSTGCNSESRSKGTKEYCKKFYKGMVGVIGSTCEYPKIAGFVCEI